jgi:O-antigen biosynthesis protein
MTYKRMGVLVGSLQMKISNLVNLCEQAQQKFKRNLLTIFRRLTIAPVEKDPEQLVKALYQGAFNRQPDTAGFKHHLHALRNGTSFEDLAQAFVRSPEFSLLHGEDRKLDANFIKMLYSNSLGREPDEAGFENWMKLAKRGLSRGTTLAMFVRSKEALARVCRIEKGNVMIGQGPYGAWIQAHDALSDLDQATIRTHITGLPYQPLFSIILIIASVSPKDLGATLDSIATQLYPHWQLCVAIPSGTESFWIRQIQEHIKKETRIKLLPSEISPVSREALNTAIELANGEFVTFVTAGDRLSARALYESAVESGRGTPTDIIYSDRDLIDSTGRRFSPWFKPAWDPDLLLAQHYLNDLTIYRRDLLEKIGLFREGVEGAEFYDLALRASTATEPDRIRHVPVVLYHRRFNHPEIEPLIRSVNPTFNRALRDHLDMIGYPDAEIESSPQYPSAIRVVWPIPITPPLVSIIIPTRDRSDLLEHGVEGILNKTKYNNLELLIVDNDTRDAETLSLLKTLPKTDSRVRVITIPGQFNHSAVNNAAARVATGEVLLFLNNDVFVMESGWLREMVSQAIRPDIGIVGAKLLYPNGEIQHAGFFLDPDVNIHYRYKKLERTELGYFGQLAVAQTLSAVSASCLAMRREVFLEIGGFDEVNLTGAFNDVDLCLRAGDYGYRVIWTPFAELFHLEATSVGADTAPLRKELIRNEHTHLRKTWGPLLKQGDPYYNPNKLISFSQVEIPSPPRHEKTWQKTMIAARSMVQMLDSLTTNSSEA